MAGKRSVLTCCALLLLLVRVNASTGSDHSPPGNQTKDHEEVPELKVAKVDYHHVSGPFTIMVWILIASLAKLVFHLSQKLSSVVPESCLVILLGIVIGLFMNGVGLNAELPFFSSSTFFLFLLPPIVFEAGYFLQDRAFFNNIGTILLYAVVGTLINAFTVGLSLFALGSRAGLDISLLNSLVFSTLIAAVDPVAVLAVFEEIHVNVVLYILVFGESLLNDAVTVVLYRLFETMSQIGSVTYVEVLLGILSFLVVSVGGTLIGVVWGFLTAFITKYTDHVQVIEPIFVFIMSYLAYLCAEMFHLSGILSIVACAIIMKPYVEANISRKSHTTIKYFLKMLSSSSETIIFMLLGVAVVTHDHEVHGLYVFLTVIFVLVYRSVGVVLLTNLANRFRLVKLSAVDQFIMSYGGIRGAVSFSLSITLSEKHFPQKNMIVTTTIFVVLFTIFIQGMTIKPLVRLLKVQLQKKEEPNVAKEMNQKLLDHLCAGMEEILGHHGKSHYKELIEYVHTHYLRPWLIRDANEDILDADLLMAVRRMEYKDALTQLREQGTAAMLCSSQSDQALSRLVRSSFEAAAITSSEPEESEGSEDEPMLRSGDTVRVPDVVLKDRGQTAGPAGSDQSTFSEENAPNFSTLFDYTQPRYLRKFHRNNILDEDEELYRRFGKRDVQPLVSPRPHHHKHHHHRKHHHHKHGHHKRSHTDAPPKKNLSMIMEQEEVPDSPVKSTASGSGDEEDGGISFSAGSSACTARGRLPSSEDCAADFLKGPTDPSQEDEAAESIPLQSVVVDIKDDPSETHKTD